MLRGSTVVALVLLAGCGFHPRAASDDAAIGRDAGIVDAAADAMPIAGVPGGVATDALLWLAADRGVEASGGRVDTWKDESPARRDAVAATSGERPAVLDLGFNFNPAIAFDGNRLATLQPVFAPGTSYPALAIFLVLADPTTSFDWILYEGQTGYDRFSLSRNYAGGRSDFDLTTSNRLSTAQPLPGSLVAWSAGPAGTALTIDGSPVASEDSYTPYIGTNDVLQLGDNAIADDSRNSPFHGSLAEIYLVASQLTAPQQQQIESYLALKYGITLAGNYLASDGTVVWPSGQGFDHDIAGIGRDDHANLRQRQACSAAGTSLVTIGAGAIAASNTANTAALPDRAYLVWGDDGQALSWRSDGVPAGVARRLARTYRLVATGAVGTVELAVPTATSSAPERLPSSGSSAILLLVDADADFSAGTQVIPMTMSSDGQHWVATLDAATAYVTIGVGP